ncbi:bifunctional 4-hydroxy-2-oxoglutarate aldolase/2-dehydro-3-deoxy-phosphogluconate aldolase [Verrucomicrobiales bacterium BCK34]|nr:bifunctional 4-hydroxy-2-oxoglutarate aldolase/2-dehydro-3-deoxy-phosphogluconate aldolase [Verrucomicrobiales bacterium BCK34]
MSLTPESNIGQSLAKSKVLAVLVIDDVEAAVPLAESLLAGGVDAMELTLRTPVALDAARKIRESVPEMTVGIGTVLQPDQVDAAVEAGAHFAVSPGVNPEVIRHATSRSLPFGPGVMTPTDIDIAVREGCRLLKFFPSESSGGLAHLKNISAPYLHLGLKFIPLGGITVANLATYLESDLIAAVGGSWLAPRDVIAAKDWKRIESNAREAMSIAG